MTVQQRKKRINQLRNQYHILTKGGSRKGLWGARKMWAKHIDTAISIHLGKIEQAGVYGY